MRKKLLTFILAAIGVVCFSAQSRAGTAFYGKLAGEPGLAYNKAYVLDLSTLSINSLATQINLSTNTNAAQVFSDGDQSTATITVSSWTALLPTRSVGWIKIASNTALAGSRAYDTISIASNAALDGNYAMNYIWVSSEVMRSSAVITLNGLTYAASTQFSLGASSIATAINIMNMLNGIYGITASTFNGGSSITVVSSRLGSIYNNYTMSSSTPFAMTVAFSSFIGGYDPVYLTLNGNKILTANSQFSVPASSYTTAVNLAAAFKGIDYGIVASTGLTGTSSVTVSVSLVGSIYNSYTLTSSSPNVLAVSSPNFVGGSDPVTIKVNGVGFTNSADWFTGFAASNTAQSLYLAIASNTSLASVIITSWPTNSFINFTAVATGPAYQYQLFSSSVSAVNLSGVSASFSGSTSTTLTGGQPSNARIHIANIMLIQGVDWTAALSASDTAKSIDAAIKVSSLSSIILSSWTFGGVIYTTSVANGKYQNFYMKTSTQSALGISGPFTYADASSGSAVGAMTGGSDSSYSTTTDIVKLTSHTFTTGMKVMYSSSSAVDVSPLMNQTTYFVILVDSNSIKIALTSSGAIAGIPIDLLSQSTQIAPHTFSLTPSTFAGAPTITWQVSNDSANWYNVGGGSSTFNATWTSTSTLNDFGAVNYRYIRANVIGPTSGSLNMQIHVHGKN